MPLRIDLPQTPRHALLWAVVGFSFVCAVMFLFPIPPAQRYAAALPGAWLCFASAIRYLALHAERPPEAHRSIPLRFSGELGRFELRPRADGRRVEVRAGPEVIAEVVASDEGDELVLNDELVADSELEAFGAALGQAIEMAAVADEDGPVERRVTGPRSWGRA
jgi:hypothetical protein